MTRAPVSDVGVACVQLTPERGNPASNLERSVAAIVDAAQAGNELILLPELSNSGYAFADRAEALAAGEAIPDGPTLRAWRDVAREHKVWVVGGLAERYAGGLADSAVLIDRDGSVLSVYRKMNLWSVEHLWFEPGLSPSEVVNLPIGRVAMAICFDLWVPELFRHYARAGADIVCIPSNWSCPSVVGGSDRPIVDYLAIAAAHVNALFIAGADRAGADGDFNFIGGSLIVNPRGEVVARAPVRGSEPALVSARVDLMEARVRKTWSRFNHALGGQARSQDTAVTQHNLAARSNGGRPHADPSPSNLGGIQEADR
jgi:predicted amidohydrolase